jgi:geranylgeranyl pyrophosphate synthase
MEPRLDPAVMRRLSRRLSTVAAAGGAWLREPLHGVLNRPGKRLRPALVYAVAGLGPAPDEAAAFECATALELLHLSSLVHDDLMDSADSRGGLPTLHLTHGVGAAVLAGDILAAAGGATVARVGPVASAAWQDAYLAMCRGQAAEAALRHHLPKVEECVAVMEGKTATLIGAACRVGAWCGGMPPAWQEAFAAYGLAFGLVFQLLDDLMDVLSTPRLWGKPVRHDVTQGIYTLPVILAGLESVPSEVDTRAVYRQAREEGVPPALHMLAQWAHDAWAALHDVAPSPALEQLRDLPRRYATAVLSRRTAPAHRAFVDGLLATRLSPEAVG